MSTRKRFVIRSLDSGRAIIVGIMAFGLNSGCDNPYRPSSTGPGAGAAQSAAYDELDRRYVQQLDQGDAQIARIDQHADKYDAILDKWEEQATRMDRLLDMLEKKAEEWEK